MKIKFTPIEKEIDVNPNKTLLQLCTENGIEIKSICKGVPSCAECRVNITAGEHNILPPSKAELSLIGTNYFIDGRRLSCQVRCFGDVTVDLTDQLARAESQTKKVRGFRTPQASKGTASESHAKQGTLVLEESHVKDSQQQPEKAASSKGEPREHNRDRHRNRHRDQKGGSRPQNKGPENK